MRRSLLPAFAALVLLATPALAATSAVGRHINLVTNYPAVTVKAGETTNLDIKLENQNLPPEALKLSVADVPTGWKAELIGNDRPIASAMPDTNESVDVSLRLDVPDGAKPGSHEIMVKATGHGISETLPINVTIGDVLPPKIEIKPKLPSLRGSLSGSFDYEFTLKNDSSENLTVKLAAATPPNFDASFTEEYGSQQLSAVPVEAGKSKDMKLKVSLPPDAAAGSYQVKVHASTRNASADMTLGLDATGEPKIALASADERLNADAEAGKATQINLVVTNDGSAPAKNVEVSATPPSNWKVSFAPKKIERAAAERQAHRGRDPDAVGEDHRRRLHDHDQGERRRRRFVVPRLPHLGHDLDHVGRVRPRHHRHRAAGARRRRDPVRPAMSAHRHRGPRPAQGLRPTVAVDGLDFTRRCGRDLRPARPQRLRQDHHHPDAAGADRAERRWRLGAGRTIPCAIRSRSSAGSATCPIRSASTTT